MTDNSAEHSAVRRIRLALAELAEAQASAGATRNPIPVRLKAAEVEGMITMATITLADRDLTELYRVTTADYPPKGKTGGRMHALVTMIVDELDELGRMEEHPGPVGGIGHQAIVQQSIVCDTLIRAARVILSGPDLKRLMEVLASHDVQIPEARG